MNLLQKAMFKLKGRCNHWQRICCINIIGSIHMRASQLKSRQPQPNIVQRGVKYKHAVKCESTVFSKCNRYIYRKHTCGELRVKDVGARVTVYGWLEHRRLSKFAVLRDAYGQIQLIVDSNDETNRLVLQSTPLESLMCATGTVVARPPGMVNKLQDTGAIEIHIDEIRCLNAAVNIPFHIASHNKANEKLRMEHRYLDMRFALMQRNMRMRAQIMLQMRKFLQEECGFVEVETPTLTARTPGGAQEFLVPTRQAGRAYALTQSPQIFKQMLMAGAIDRYFQFARCYRDEHIRSDRQPEFTQLDLEMCFTTPNGVMQLVEDLLRSTWPESAFYGSDNTPFPRVTFAEALTLYGTDKPDMRYKDFTIQGGTDEDEIDTLVWLPFPRCKPYLNRSYKMEVLRLAEGRSLLTILKVDNKTDLERQLHNTNLGNYGSKIFNMDASYADKSIIFVARGKRLDALSLLGQVRMHFIERLESCGYVCTSNDSQRFSPVWITDFPLFELKDSTEMQCVHHPFTAPHPDDVHLLLTEPLKVRSLAYDLVLNGTEVGGGSIRIHDASTQEQIFKLLNMQSNLGYFLNVLRSGCPPHGGIALGIDRLLAKIFHCDSIRDVIAFPKTLEGRDLLTGAPTEISAIDRHIYHL